VALDRKIQHGRSHAAAGCRSMYKLKMTLTLVVHGVQTTASLKCALLSIYQVKQCKKLKTLKNCFIPNEHENNHISNHKSIYFSMEDEVGITTPDICFLFLGQSLSFLFPRSLFVYILTHSNNNSRKT